MLGAAVGQVANMVFPGITAEPGAYALVGMGAAFAGTIRTPLTSVIMIFEVTRDYEIIVPLMIANMLAFFISQKLQREPIYQALARQDGLHLPSAATRAQDGAPRVVSVIREAPQPIEPDATPRDALQRVSDSALESWPVADSEKFLGMVRVSDLSHAVEGSGEADTVRKVMQQDQAHGSGRAFAHLHTDFTLDQALARMGEARHNVLPVVSRADIGILLGIVTLADILDAYGVEARGRKRENPEPKA
jgi:CIC family chloride channel protein